MNGYVAFVEGVRHEIHATTSYAASVQARALYTGRKKHPRVDVHLVELDGAQVDTVISN